MSSGSEGNSRPLVTGDLTSGWRWLLLAATVLPVLAVTLTPAGSRSVLTEFGLCLICGEFGTANLLRNVVLFIPLGVAFALLLGPGRWALFSIFALTATIETLQLYIPGRNPLVADLTANFTGGALMVGAVRSAGWWLAPGRGAGAALSLASAVLASAAFLGTAWLYEVELPETTYWGQWTPNRGHLGRYHGQVISASVGDIPTRSWRLEHPTMIRSALLRGQPVRVTAEVGPPPRSVAPIFSIYDGNRDEILLLGAHREDLVSRIRYRAHRLGFDRPDVRIPDGFVGVEAGDTVTLEYQVAGGESCLTLNDRRECGMGPRVERGWALLKYLEGPPEWFRRLFDFGWVFGLFLPFGYFARRHFLTWLGSGLLLTGFATGWWMQSVVPPSVLAFVGAGLGLLVGVGFGAAARVLQSRGFY